MLTEVRQGTETSEADRSEVGSKLSSKAQALSKGAPAAEIWLAHGCLKGFRFLFPDLQYFKRCQELGFFVKHFCFSNAGNQLKIFFKTFCSPKEKKKEQKHTGGQIGPGHYHFTTCVL